METSDGYIYIYIYNTVVIQFVSRRLETFHLLARQDTLPNVKLSAKIVGSLPEKTLKEIFESYESDTFSDRVVWPLLNGTHSVSLSVRPQMVSGVRTETILMEIVEEVQNVVH
jgi:hypothetical protein